MAKKRRSRRRGRNYSTYQLRLNDRTIEEAKMIADKDMTYDEVSRRFGICVATVYKDMKLRLPHLDKTLYERVVEVTDRHRVNATTRAIEARMTKKKYLDKNFDFSIFK